MIMRYRQPGRLWLATAACVALASAARGAPRKATAVTCASCHRAEAQSQPRTDMGIGIELPPNQAILQAHPKLTFEKNGYRYNIERKNGTSTYTVSDGSGTLTLPIKYAFGVQNQTFVLEYEGRFYESLVSYYERINGLAITLGDERIQPHNLTEAMGRRTENHEITACFGCHATGGASQEKLTLATLKPGLDCEHCHAGAEAHMQGMAGGKPAAVPRKLGEMAAEEMSNYCGECHRTWESVVGLRLFGEKNVRFQPYRLANSQCFLGNDKRIRCTACHDPHVELVREDASYDGACLSCHATKTGAASAAATQKACPVADKNCVSCHMPKVQVGTNPAIFTDHNIRVVHAGDAYPQ
jgi:hypothetical protein